MLFYKLKAKTKLYSSKFSNANAIFYFKPYKSCKDLNNVWLPYEGASLEDDTKYLVVKIVVLEVLQVPAVVWTWLSCRGYETFCGRGDVVWLEEDLEGAGGFCIPPPPFSMAGACLLGVVTVEIFEDLFGFGCSASSD